MPTILLVEDNDPNRDALGRRLQRRGYQVVDAIDGRQAVAAARDVKPDLILMDFGMPVMDGWEATHLLKADADTQRIPIIVLSAHAMANDRERALQAGADDFDSKPIHFERLVEKIEDILRAAAPSRD